MRSATSSEDSRLVRIAVPCAQTRVAIEMCSQTNGAKCCAFREVCLAGHQASSEARDEVCSLTWSGDRFNVRAEQERCHCSGEFKRCLHRGVWSMK